MVRDDILDRRLCPAVCVGRADWAVLRDRDHVRHAGRVTVDGGRRREDNVAYVVLLHGAQERNAATNIDAVVLERDLARLADGLEGGKVDDAVNLGMRIEDLVERGLVGYVDIVEGGSLAADKLDAVDGNGRGVIEVIDDYDIVVILE